MYEEAQRVVAQREAARQGEYEPVNSLEAGLRYQREAEENGKRQHGKHGDKQH